MRIVGGRHRGRALVAPPGSDVRPTSDRAREALFNILSHGAFNAPFRDAVVLDAFAGTGALGLEALSRGAAEAYFLETDRRALDALRRNVEGLGETARAHILAGDATRPRPALRAAAVAFLDPPYGSGLAGPALTALAAAGWLAPEAITTVEVAAKEAFTPPGGFDLLDERRYGAARLFLLRRS
jgi:16S rRNA (guanine966-N2)-methyltransferase